MFLVHFSDASPRQTSVVVVVLETGEVYIISSLSTKHDTQVVYIDPTTGSLCHFGKLGRDVFNSREEAFDYITNGSRQCKSTTTGRAIIGYSVLGSTGLLLVATKVNLTVPDLPGGGSVYTVVESQWIKVQFQNPQPQGKSEVKNSLELAELDIDGKYYFCETRDLTRPFPSEFTLRDPDLEFVWNAWFSKPFKDIGLEEHCVVLLQVFQLFFFFLLLFCIFTGHCCYIQSKSNTEGIDVTSDTSCMHELAYLLCDQNVVH